MPISNNLFVEPHFGQGVRDSGGRSGDSTRTDLHFAQRTATYHILVLLLTPQRLTNPIQKTLLLRLDCRPQRLGQLFEQLALFFA